MADTRESRAKWIPKSRNLPGFPEGAHGQTLLQRLREQALAYGAPIRQARVKDLRLLESGFAATVGESSLAARTVILATGVAEVIPPVPGLVEAIERGLVRVCPICDGYETEGLRVGVLGSGEHAAGEALFLRTFTRDVHLVLTSDAAISDGRRRELSDLGVPVTHTQLASVSVEGRTVAVAQIEDGRLERFDAVYAAFGVRPRVALARGIGAAVDDDGRLAADRHQQTSVPGLYAAGDVVQGLNQISVAEGEGSIAATSVHNRLARNPLGAATAAG